MTDVTVRQFLCEGLDLRYEGYLPAKYFYFYKQKKNKSCACKSKFDVLVVK